MDPQSLQARLSRISTQWTVVFNAHGGGIDAAQAAQARLMQRYSGAAYRYLLGATRDADVAEELAQEFALRFVRGSFRNAAPERGRFRDYLKAALSNLVNDHHRAKQAWPKQMAEDAPEPAAPGESVGAEPDFLQSWREELLERTWNALAAVQPAYRAALQLRIENPDMPSAEMAERLTEQLGKPFSAALVRKSLQRAHTRFAELLLDEVAASLEDPTPEELRAELEEVDLLKYCRTALERRR